MSIIDYETEIEYEKMQWRIDKLKNMFGGATISDIKHALTKIDVLPRNVFICMHPFDGSEPLSFLMIKDRLNISFKEIHDVCQDIFT